MRPIRSTPRLSRPPWGGRRLAEAGKGEGPIGESWEIWRDNPAGAGSLADLVAFPLLIKLIDTAERLSVQVHPDDLAARADGHPCGKAEAWVVLDAAPGARIAYGLRRELSPAEFVARARSGAIEEDLHWIEPRAGDVIDVPPGTIHAIGAGITLYEVQQPVDLTWRIYDWGRPRELHLEKAAEVARLGPQRPSASRRMLAPGLSRLFESSWAVVEEVELPATRDGWEAITVIEGEARVDGLALGRWESLLLPPGAWRIEGAGRLLAARVPGL